VTRRFVAVALAATAVAALAVPWLLGLRVELLYHRFLDDLAARGYRIVQDEYHRGWLGARALTQIGPPMDLLTGAEAGSEAPRLQIISRVTHGPRGANLRRWPPLLGTSMSRVTVVGGARALPPLLVNGSIDVLGAIDSAWQIPDVAYSGALGQLHLIGGEGRLRADGDRREWGGDGELARLEVIDRSGQALVLEGLGWRFAGRWVHAGLPAGESELSLQGLSLDGTGQRPPLKLSDARLQLQARMEQGRADLSAGLAVDQLSVDHAEFAPSRLRLALTGVDMLALGALRDAMRTYNAQELPESIRGLALGALLTQSLPRLLSGAPHLALDDLELMTPQGPVNGLARLQVAAMDAADLARPSHWLKRLSGEARIAAPQALVLQQLVDDQQRRVRDELRRRGERFDPLPPRLATEVEQAAQASLAALIRNGWLVADQGRLSAAVLIGDGLLTVNGKTIPIAGMARDQ
jgi:uncharacterized protein YdgA (DUF945 family)